MSQDHSIDTSLRHVTKSEACQLLNVSLSTLNRRIAEGQLEVERVQQGQIHRVFVLLPADTDRPEAPEEAEPDGGTELAVAQERIRNLEELVTLQRDWLDLGSPGSSSSSKLCQRPLPLQFRQSAGPGGSSGNTFALLEVNGRRPPVSSARSGS